MEDIKKIKEILRNMVSADIEIVIQEAVLELKKKAMYEAVQTLMSSVDRANLIPGIKQRCKV